ncbi:integrase [Mesorhizobium sp. B3-1-3]|uniref:DUF6538 domain-containing protein n=1 Tax=unclassified Mesorhizobium TaxID=325217 RepID=UPI00112DBBEA|nr:MULTISPECIES: DUF6538 domain-containing protein [unclassified Mesorhizobium]TPI59867.1 integrase [Mesorhizobium sp. B3-1-8]TPI68221.1 integrase [Mesorhizobium sp. B3-1-3]
MRRIKISPDRYLHCRGGIYQYHRRVPAQLALIDKRFPPIIRLSLETDDILTAREKRNIYEQAHNDYWAALISDECSAGDALDRYGQAVRHAKALGFSYRTAAEVAKLPIEEIVQRVVAVMGEKTPATAVQAVLGTVDLPAVTFTEVLEIYEKMIASTQLMGKSVRQRARWKTKLEWAIAGFHDVIGVVEIGSITREMTTRYKEYWVKKIVPDVKDRKDQQASKDQLSGERPKLYSVSTGNRAIGALSKLYKAYYTHIGQRDRQNPFADLSFSEPKKKKRKAIRPPFSTGWIVEKFLHGSALDGMNEEARGIFLALIETGARPAEICNLRRDDIVLDGPVPHIRIRPSMDLDDPFELKTGSSERDIPLVGVALKVFQKFQDGFPRYYDNSNSFSATCNKYLEENNLLETEKHVVYSLRHAFEDRMKNAKIDAEVRKMMVGHSIDRPEYGEGGGLRLWQKGLKRMALPFDPRVV